MITNIRHTGIVVKNLEESLHFYTLLGFTVSVMAAEVTGFISKISAKTGVDLTTIKLLAPDGSMIELLDYKRNVILLERTMFGTGIAHIAFTVHNVEEVYKELRAEGIKFNSTPQVSPTGYAKVVFCKAPEGTFIELVEVLV